MSNADYERVTIENRAIQIRTCFLLTNTQLCLLWFAAVFLGLMLGVLIGISFAFEVVADPSRVETVYPTKRLVEPVHRVPADQVPSFYDGGQWNAEPEQ